MGASPVRARQCNLTESGSPRGPPCGDSALSRAWTQQSGSLATRLEFTRADAFTNGYSYVLRDASGTSIEAGSVELEALAKPLPTIDFVATGGRRRRGVYSIRDETMQIAYGAAGAPRLTSLTAGSTYTTQR